MPQPDDTPDHAAEQMSIRAYFAAHAPEQPWQGFEPTIVQKPPARPPSNPLPNAGTYGTGEETMAVRSWIDDQSYDLAEDVADRFSHWIDAWLSYKAALASYKELHAMSRWAQWPWYWADCVLASQHYGEPPG